ncbi:unnamed protein product [Rhizoctonia solani]|uniref:Uncharacterized protein n=1 Tax=Rhizoctonia solani TaxID=456999 RepID=A0A8H3HIA1_9AGAM|nr:unnamed protein product [Rhizoctonia solani]CAE6518801.1 unnamed protein product [Rhizoctonia solani]
MTQSIRYYDLTNAGIGIIIHFKLVDESGNTVWDGSGAPALDIGQKFTYDLYNCNEDGKLNGKVFYLSSSTVAGHTYTEKVAAFTYDENSKTVASAERRGTSLSGELDFTGTWEHS